MVLCVWQLLCHCAVSTTCFAFCSNTPLVCRFGYVSVFAMVVSRLKHKLEGRSLLLSPPWLLLVFAGVLCKLARTRYLKSCHTLERDAGGAKSFRNHWGRAHIPVVHRSIIKVWVVGGGVDLWRLEPATPFLGCSSAKELNVRWLGMVAPQQQFPQVI